MERNVTVQEMVRGLWMRRRLVLWVFAAVLVAAVPLVLGLPSVYRATTVVRVEPNRPSRDLVQPTVTQLIEDRLKTVRFELLARPILERTITELNLYPREIKKRGLEAGVEEMRKDLDVRVEGENAFVLSVQGEDPELAARIANRLPELFAEHALELRDRQAQLAASLYDAEIARLDKELQERDGRVTAFKVAHLGELPEQLEASLRGLERVMGLITARTDARRETERRRFDLERLRHDADTEAGRLKRREDEVGREIVAARSRWTDDHPESVRLVRELEVTLGRRAAAEDRAKRNDTERAHVRAQSASLAMELRVLEGEAQRYRERIDRTPQWGQTLSVMRRDYDMLKAKYDSLVSRKVEAELSRELELRARASLFNVLSQARVPVTPFKPDRATAALLAVLGAAAAAILVGVFRELQDESLRRAEHARDIAVPVLAVIPEIRGAVSRTGRAACGS